MTTPAASTLRSELQAVIGLLGPQIAGLRDFTRITDSLSPELQAHISTELGDQTRRRELCQAVIVALDALEADGYPDMPKERLTPEQAAELAQQMADFQAAFARFEEEGTVVGGTFVFPAPTPKV